VYWFASLKKADYHSLAAARRITCLQDVGEWPRGGKKQKMDVLGQTGVRKQRERRRAITRDAESVMESSVVRVEWQLLLFGV
jgi:hypothetical protein